MENNMQVPQKTKNRVTKWSCNPTPGHTSGENYNSKRYRHPNVHSSTIYNSQNMEATECPSAGKWIKNMWYKYTTDYYSFIENNEILPFAAKMDGPRDKLCLSGVRTVWVAMSCSSLQSVLRAFNPSPYPKDQGRSPRLRTQHARTVGLFSTGNCHLARILWWVFFFFLFMLPSEIPKVPTDPTFESVYYCEVTSPPSLLPTQEGSPSLNSLSLFSSLSFVLPHFEEMGLPFWVSAVLCQRSEVVLWKLLHM